LNYGRRGPFKSVITLLPLREGCKNLNIAPWVGAGLHGIEGWFDRCRYCGTAVNKRGFAFCFNPFLRPLTFISFYPMMVDRSPACSLSTKWA
jgi:hypothetical protein